jgi:hypothetical protein
MVDYILLSDGLAGSFAEIALKDNKSIVVFDNASQSSSKIAEDYNPLF